MYFRIIEHNSSVKLHRSPELSEGGGVSGRTVSVGDIQSGADNPNDPGLQAFYLAIQVLMAGEKRQARIVQLLTTAGVRDVKVEVKSVADYLEIYRYPDIVRQRPYKEPRSGDEMVNYDELNDQLRTVFQPIKSILGLPASNPSEFSYAVPADFIPSVRSNTCKNYLKSLVTCTLTSREFEKTITRLRRDFPNEAETIITALRATESRDHLSAISFNDRAGQLLVSIVNINGDLLQLEGYKFLRLVEEHRNESGGWLSLGLLDREKEWLPDPLIKFNKESSGEIIAHYSALDSSIKAVRRVTDKKSGSIGTTDQALFIIDQDYLVCLYVAIKRLKEDKQSFERLREIAETKEVANMDELESDLFD